GSGLPSFPVRANVCVRLTVPRAQGTPQLTPTSVPGPAPPSHPMVTLPSPCDCCWSIAAAVLARIPMALRRVIFIASPQSRTGLLACPGQEACPTTLFPPLPYTAVWLPHSNPCAAPTTRTPRTQSPVT